MGPALVAATACATCPSRAALSAAGDSTRALTLPLLPRFHRCPHGTMVGIGAIGIMYSDCGGPCHNEPLDGGRGLRGNWYIAYLD
jgi:hypothetical protein